MADKPLLFGTDGVRGVAGDYPLDPATVWKLGRALGQVLERTETARPPRIVLGEDTRESSAWISRAVAAGLHSSGVEVTYAGVITTPGVAFLARHRRLSAGVMVSASHNPYQDNGVKVLSAEGTKLPESLELEVERVLRQSSGPARVTPEPLLKPDPRLLEDYVAHLEQLAPNRGDLSAYRLVVDCAHGAASRVAPALLERLGLRAHILNHEPNGRNINRECGSLHPKNMAEGTKAWGANLGVAFDGDADRVICATHEGRIADGDHILYALAPYLYRRDRLKGRAVVGTEMSNLGLELALAQFGLGLRRTPVGDKYVLEEMLRSGINLGGEPSGHIIFSDLSLTGDGLVTFLQVLRLLQETDEPLGHLVRELKPFPQIIRNVRVRERRPFDAMPEVTRTIMESRRELAARGRVVVRYSGTELLARVMVEAEEADVVERHVARIAAAIDSSVGRGSTA